MRNVWLRVRSSKNVVLTISIGRFSAKFDNIADISYFAELSIMHYRMSIKTRLAGCDLMLGLFIFLPVLYFGGAYTEAPPRPFNSERWKSVDLWGDARCAMLADLRTRIGIDGKTRAELYELM